MAHREVPARLTGALLRLMEGVVGPDGVGLPARYTHQQLASMIGANLEAVKRTLKTLERGAVEVRGRRIHVADPEALRRAAWEAWAPPPSAAYEPNRPYTDRATGGRSVGK